MEPIKRRHVSCARNTNGQKVRGMLPTARTAPQDIPRGATSEIGAFTAPKGDSTTRRRAFVSFALQVFSKIEMHPPNAKSVTDRVIAIPSRPLNRVKSVLRGTTYCREVRKPNVRVANVVFTRARLGLKQSGLVSRA